MFISVLHLRMSYKLRMLPVNISITSFQSEVTETPVLGSETISPRGDMGKRWEEVPVSESSLCLVGAPQVSVEECVVWLIGRLSGSPLAKSVWLANLRRAACRSRSEEQLLQRSKAGGAVT